MRSSRSTEVKSEDRGRPLYHFEHWLDAPPAGWEAMIDLV